VLTLSNLRNLDRAQERTTTTQGWSLPLHPVQGGNGGHALFCVAQAGHNASALVLTSAPSSLRLALCPRAQMQPRVVYAFSFTVVNVNPEEEQDGGTVFVSAQGSAPAANIDVTPLVNSPAAPGTPARRLLKGMCECVCVVHVRARAFAHDEPRCHRVHVRVCTHTSMLCAWQTADARVVLTTCTRLPACAQEPRLSVCAERA